MRSQRSKTNVEGARSDDERVPAAPIGAAGASCCAHHEIDQHMYSGENVQAFLFFSMWLKRIGIVIAAMIPVAIVGSFVFSSADDRREGVVTNTGTGTTPSSTAAPSGSETVAVPSVESTPTTEPTSASMVYANGTYTADGTYTSPMGPERITVTLTIADDVVTAASMTGTGIGGSALWQGKFASGLEGAVLGKNIADLELKNVSGSSLTPIGFNAALQTIKTQALL